jgi:hypothetical protein
MLVFGGVRSLLRLVMSGPSGVCLPGCCYPARSGVCLPGRTGAAGGPEICPGDICVLGRAHALPRPAPESC